MTHIPLVLVVDDDAFLRFVAMKQMKVVGLDCHTAINGAEAVKMLGNGYDVIFMDLSMPVLGGIEATEQIRALETANQLMRTRIVGLTAFDEREKAVCMHVGMDAFIRKPLLLDQLNTIALQLQTGTYLNQPSV